MAEEVAAQRGRRVGGEEVAQQRRSLVAVEGGEQGDPAGPARVGEGDAAELADQGVAGGVAEGGEANGVEAAVDRGELKDRGEVGVGEEDAAAVEGAQGREQDAAEQRRVGGGEGEPVAERVAFAARGGGEEGGAAQGPVDVGVVGEGAQVGIERVARGELDGGEGPVAAGGDAGGDAVGWGVIGGVGGRGGIGVVGDRVECGRWGRGVREGLVDRGVQDPQEHAAGAGEAVGPGLVQVAQGGGVDGRVAGGGLVGEEFEEQGGGAGGGEQGGVEGVEQEAQGLAVEGWIVGAEQVGEEGVGGVELVGPQGAQGGEGGRGGVDVGRGEAQLEALPGERDGGEEVGGAPVREVS